MSTSIGGTGVERTNRNPGDGDGTQAPVAPEVDAAIFRDLYPSLRRFASAVGRLGDDPDDLVQDALARTLAKGSLAELEDPGRYLRVVMVRLASNRRRSHARRDGAMRRLFRSDAMEPAADSGLGGLDELEALSERDRAVIYLTVVEGWDHRSAGAVLGMRSGAVRTAKARALARLRTEHTSGREERS